APVGPILDLAALRDQSRQLADDLRVLIRTVNDSRPAPADRDDLIEDLNGLLDMVPGFERLLTAGPSPRELVASLRLLTRRMGLVDAQRARLVRARELSRRWREVRQRIDALSDEFELPRVISRIPSARPAGGVDRRLLAQIDRALIALDKFSSESGAGR